MKLLQFKDLEYDQVSVIQKWGEVERAVIRFGDSSKPQTFEFLFGKEEGDRLWLYYVRNCKRDIQKFKTYLTTEQNNILLINVMYNQSMYSL